MVIINVARDFTRFPAGRYKNKGDTSGQEFRERFLEPALQGNDQIVVELDGTIGYGSSFLEEAFGGLVRALQVPSAQVLSKLELKSSDESLVEEITTYIKDASNLAQER